MHQATFLLNIARYPYQAFSFGDANLRPVATTFSETAASVMDTKYLREHSILEPIATHREALPLIDDVPLFVAWCVAVQTR